MKQGQGKGAGWGLGGGPGETVPGRGQETAWLTDGSVRKTEKSSKQSAEGHRLGNTSSETQTGPQSTAVPGAEQPLTSVAECSLGSSGKGVHRALGSWTQSWPRLHLDDHDVTSGKAHALRLS